MRKGVVGLTVLLLAGCATPATMSVRPAEPSRDIAWDECASRLQRTYSPLDLDGVEASCGRMTVPLDWDHVGSEPGTLQLSLVRLHRTSQHDRIGSLVINPGGPGASGVDAAVLLLHDLPPDVLDRFDLVGFDPRGVGKSSPIICSLADPVGNVWDPIDPIDFSDTVARITAANRDCGRRRGQMARFVNTVQTAHDLDAIRTVLGDDRLTYLGWSYGTELGATYAQFFPERVRAMVLDGALSPDLSAQDVSRGQAEGFEQTFAEFAHRCDIESSCPLGPDTEASFDRLARRLDQEPVELQDNLGEIDSDLLHWLMVGALYDDRLWPAWENVLAALAVADGGPLVEFMQNNPTVNQYRNMNDAFRAVMCADRASRPEPEQARDLQTDLREHFPHFGGALGFTYVQCNGWPEGANPLVSVTASSAPPILVVGTRQDPATPYKWAEQLHHDLATSTLLTWEGAGHTAYPKTPCIVQAVDTYLIQGRAPAAGLNCPAG